MTDDRSPKPRGLACLSPERRREIARRGGLKSRGGFALMSPERRREVASHASRVAKSRGKQHRWTSEEAAAAGRKGGRISRPPRRPKEA